MQTLAIQLYKDYLLKLKRGNYKGVISNAKPYTLLSIFLGIENSVYKNNQIQYDLLIIDYKSVNAIFKVQKPTPLSYPFYHLISEEFYHLKWKSKPIKTKSPSAKFIRENIEYAYLDNALWDLLQDKEVREIYKQTLIENYLQ